MFDFALPVLVMNFVGIFGTGIVGEQGLMQKFSRILSPIFAYTNLPDTCASFFLVSIGPRIAANSIVFQEKTRKLPVNRQLL